MCIFTTLSVFLLLHRFKAKLVLVVFLDNLLIINLHCRLFLFMVFLKLIFNDNEMYDFLDRWSVSRSPGFLLTECIRTIKLVASQTIGVKC